MLVESLVIRARSQNGTRQERHEAFGQLVSRFQEMAVHVAYGVLGDLILAQDAVQEAFVWAYQNLDQLREPKAFPGWFKQIVWSQAHRLVRGKQVEEAPLLPDVPTREMDPVAAAEAHELKYNVLEAIQALPEHEQEVTRLFYLAGYSQQEIASLLELPLTTVKKRLQYARQRLEGLLFSVAETLYPPKPVPIRVRTRPQLPPERR
ncbi:MAG: sigma-70 family RNA polymerase sigma factor [Chloroflexi bacterium]|nr:sigma-70 family RNA polymerase sigma factor [Chloroflexota bacterium]MBP8059153.1 sigma-70 family RNA polymerase sigma factor [Chloroflexota bacterium]